MSAIRGARVLLGLPVEGSEELVGREGAIQRLFGVFSMFSLMLCHVPAEGGGGGRRMSRGQ
jgi:hypothetical protein